MESNGGRKEKKCYKISQGGDLGVKTEQCLKRIKEYDDFIMTFHVRHKSEGLRPYKV